VNTLGINMTVGHAVVRSIEFRFMKKIWKFPNGSCIIFGDSLYGLPYYESLGEFTWLGIEREIKMVTKDDLNNWFTYNAPKGDQPERYVKIREAAKNLAEVILENTPVGPDQTTAIRKVREAVMTANQSIACGE